MWPFKRKEPEVIFIPPILEESKEEEPLEVRDFIKKICNEIDKDRCFMPDGLSYIKLNKDDFDVVCSSHYLCGAFEIKRYPILMINKKNIDLNSLERKSLLNAMDNYSKRRLEEEQKESERNIELISQWED